jgi:hypothetical protein
VVIIRHGVGALGGHRRWPIVNNYLGLQIIVALPPENSTISENGENL